MKSILTILFILVSGVAASANTTDHQSIVNPQIENYEEAKFIETRDVVDSGIVIATKYNEVKAENENNVTRLYKFKNSRIKKALSFTTKRNKSKMA